MSSITRRKFILSGTAPLVAASLLPTRLRASNDKISVALVGCGGRGVGALSQLLKADPDTQLVAMADISSDRLLKANDRIQKFANELQLNCPQDRMFVGLDAYKKAISECDLAILATPPGFRPLHFTECVVQGKHTFLEKGFGVDAPGIRLMMESSKIAKEKNLKCLAGLNRRFTPSYQNAIKNIHDGLVGDILSMEATWHTGLPPKVDRQPEQGELPHQLDNWRRFVWLSGDICSDLLLAGVDVCLWAKGMVPEKATGRCGREQAGPDLINGDTCDFFNLEYVFGDRSTLRASVRTWRDSTNKVSEEIVGTKGRASLDSNSARITDLKGDTVWLDRPKTGKASTKQPEPYLLEQEKLVKCIRNNEHLNNLDEALNTQVAVLMGRMAAYSGKEVGWDEALLSDEKFFPESLSWAGNPPTLPTKFGDYTMPPRALSK